MAKKIETAEEALSLLRSGCKLTLSKGKFFVTGIEGEAPVYLKAAIRDKMKETNPVLFSAYAEINDALLKGHDEPEEQKEKLAGLTEGLPESAPEEKNVEPGTDITPNEFIMHDTERRLLETIITLENLHLVPEVKRYEIPFANLIEDANGNLIASDGGGDKMRTTAKRFSLVDMAVRKLVETYHKWQKVKDIEKERDALLLERDELLDEIDEVQYNYNDLTYATAIKIVSKR